MRVLQADMVSIDERTDVRDVIESNVGRRCLKALEKGIAAGEVRVAWGLMGWGERNATLYDATTGAAYHALVEA